MRQNMGRGLSKLQRFILHKASKIRRVHYPIILVEFFGWEPDPDRRNYRLVKEGDLCANLAARKLEPAKPDEIGSLKNPRCHIFSRKMIGEKKYRSTMASLSRACLRLEDRGLVTCLVGARSHWSGVELTDAGRAWLSANSKETFH
jgi:hypothetical protein